MSDEFTVTLESGDLPCDGLRVRALRGKEAISSLDGFDVEVVCVEGAAPAASDFRGARVTLTLALKHHGAAGAWHAQRYYHGIVAEVEDLLATSVELRAYRLRVVPHAALLGLVELQDIFMNVSVPDVVRAKLAAIGQAEDLVLRLLGSYPSREFIVQYGESDYAFVCRLLEHLGISFFVEHGHGVAKLILTDHSGGFQRPGGAEPVHYQSRGEQRDVYALTTRERLVPAVCVVCDYNYRTPQNELVGSHEVPNGFAGGVVEYGTHHKTRDEAETLARIRAEERDATQLVYEGRSAAPGLCAGTRFVLEDHPILGSCELLVIAVEHEAHLPVGGPNSQEHATYANTFKAIPAVRPFRPQRRTPRPRIAGLLTAVVDSGLVADDGRYAKLDEQGRYTVRFLFDMTQGNERAASRPVRMIQNHVGANYGTHFPVKPGTEVLVAFIDGDPDRPIIVGAVPNPLQPSPVTNADLGYHRIRTSTGITVDMKE